MNSITESVVNIEKKELVDLVDISFIENKMCIRDSQRTV